MEEEPEWIIMSVQRTEENFQMDDTKKTWGTGSEGEWEKKKKEKWRDRKILREPNNNNYNYLYVHNGILFCY